MGFPLMVYKNLSISKFQSHHIFSMFHHIIKYQSVSYIMGNRFLNRTAKPVLKNYGGLQLSTRAHFRKWKYLEIISQFTSTIGSSKSYLLSLNSIPDKCITYISRKRSLIIFSSNLVMGIPIHFPHVC